MRQTATRVLILIFLSTTLGYSQQIWPGDANNNGIANSVDLLYWGMAYGATGTPRINPTIDWTGQDINSMWPGTTPNGVNFVYADADGNGIINDIDRAGAMVNNIGKEHTPPTDDGFLIGSEANGDPRIRLFPSVSTTSPGNQLYIALNIGRSDVPVDSFYGMAIHLSYNPDFIKDGSVEFILDNDSWITNWDPSVKSIFYNDDASGFAEIGVTRTDHQDVLGGYGGFGALRMEVEQMTDNQLPALLKVWIDSVKLITTSMQTIPVAIDSINLQITNNPVPIYCPNVLSPVCGSDGVVYINSCYAEQAGVTDYTPGICNTGCVDPAQIDPTADCPTTYEPVCGCNGITYLNACEAEAAGVISYTTGPCNDGNCYDPTLVVTAEGTIVNNGNGTITIDCPNTYEPVCGCNGVTYDNACIAEANGITSYTAGACDDTCIDPTAIDPDIDCPTDYQPVCGCNDVTYPNACFAEAAGVLDYTTGSCGGSSTWCNEAIPIQCGDFLPNESNVGAGNQIITFPGCTGYTFYGPDKVYVINKTTAGDLQIGLEIVTPGLDLDMFLLEGNCSQTTCIAASTTSNNVTNNEGLLYEDAPIGIYYLVVDGQFSSSQGEYHLEVNCGYLQCGDAQAITCGQPFEYNNMYGNDDVSLYGCDGNIYNVENNGPEVVHYFTITQAGPVNISLTGLNENLELFLLRECDRGECIDFSQNAGINDESISAYLDAGTYYVVVDGYNGAVSDYTLEVDCTSSCNFNMLNLTATDADCGQSNGTIELLSSNGQPGFLVSWTGPVSGSFTTFTNGCTIENLPPGTYTVSSTDASGCFITGTATIYSIGDFDMNVNEQDAVCGESGFIAASFYNGTGPYHVYLAGPSSTSFNTLSTNINIDDLPIGTYQLFVTDDLGCVASEVVIIGQSSGNFSFEATPYAASCGAPGSIFVVISNGSPPYQINLTGPEGESFSNNGSTFTMYDLPGGTYTLKIEDNNSCISSQTVFIDNSGLVANVTPINGLCGNLNALKVDIPNGTGPFIIQYDGPIVGQTIAGSSPYYIQNLPNGTYAVTVEDANDCDTYQVVQLQNSQADLETGITPIHGSCGQSGGVWIDLNTGIPPYSIQWSGAAIGSRSTSNDGVNITNLPAGNYTFVITDDSGCSDLQSVTIQTTGGVNMNTDMTVGTCGALSSILVEITSGAADYMVSWDGPETGIVTISSNTYNIPDLPSGTYVVEVTDDNGCTDVATVTIPNLNEDPLTIDPLPLNGWCNFGRIWLDIDDGAIPYQVEWTGPVSGNALVDDVFGLAIQNLVSGTYTIQVTDANNCVVSEVVTVENTDVIFELTAQDVTCVQNGAITLQIMDGDPDYTIEWTGPVSGSTTTADPTFVLSDLPAGGYSFTVTDDTQCSETHTIAILEVPNVSLDPTPINGICGQNGAIWVDILDGTPDFTLSWTGPVNGSTTANHDGYNIDNLPSGTYVITVEDVDGCTDTETVTINNAADDLELIPTPINGLCGQNGAIWLDITGGTPDFALSWTGPVSGSTTANYDGYNIDNVPSGTYVIEISDANGCADVISVTVNNQPDDLELDPTPIHGVCGQNGDIWLDIVGGTANYSITWTGPTNGSATTSSNGYNIGNLPSGTYAIQISDVNGCDDNISVTINNQPDDLELDPTPINGVCGQNGDIWLDIIGGTADYTITWTGPANGSATISDDGYNIQNLPSGTYAVSITDINGCEDNISVTLNNLPDDLVLSPVAVSGICDQLGTINIGISGGTPSYTLTWSGTANGTVTTSNSSFDLFGLASGSYTIEVMDANGCTKSETVVINNVPDDLELVPTPINGICGQNGDIWLDINGGTAAYDLTWTGPVNGNATVNGDGYNIQNLPSGTYTVSITDGNGCADQISVQINNQENDLAITPTPENGICGSLGSAIISVSGGSPNYTLNWTGPQNGSASTAGNTFNLVDLPSGTYVLTLTDDIGCDTDATLTINNQEDDLTLTPTPTNGVCGQLGNIELDISGGTADYTINWTGPSNGSVTTGNTTYNLPNLSTGTYNISITDINGCEDMITVPINNLPDDLGLSTNVTNGLCGNQGTIVINISGGVSPYTLNWTGAANGTTTINATTFTLPNAVSGSYNFSVSDANGCTAMTTATVNNASNDLSISATPNNGICGANGSIGVNWSGGTADYTLSWDGPSSGATTLSGTSFTIPGLTNGTYSISITEATGCTISTSATINNNANDLGIITSANHGACGENGSIQVTITGGTADFMISWSGPSSGSTTISNNSFNIPDLSSGTYTINVTDTNGCSNMASATVNNLEDDLLVGTTITNALCTQAGSILLDITGGSPDYLISWSGPTSGTVSVSSNSFTIPDLVGGTYSITVTDANGCDQNTSVSVGNLPDNLEVTPTVTNGFCGENGSISLAIVGGSAPYLINWDGPDMGTVSIDITTHTIQNLPNGTYTISITDTNGCGETVTATVTNQPNDLQLSLTPNDGACDHLGSIDVSIGGGTGPFVIEWNGPSSGSMTVNENTYTIPDLAGGAYTVSITDANECTADDATTITTVDNDMMLTVTPVNGTCGEEGSFTMTVTGGTPDYTYHWTGPTSGNVTSSNTSYTYNLANAGVYSIDVTDSNGCTRVATVTIENFPNPLDAEATVDNGLCGQTGSVTVNIITGTPPYLIAWNGPVSSSETTDQSSYTINDLTTGTYTVTVTDATGCDFVLNPVVTNGANNLFSVPTLFPGDCGELGEIVVDIVGGTAPYTIAWTGTGVGNVTINDNSYTIDQLQTGNYNITVTDVNGCSDIDMEMLNNVLDNLDLVPLANNGMCGELGSITLNIFGGTPPYNIDWTGPSSGSTTVIVNLHSLSDLVSGFYTITVVDGNGCEEIESITIANQENSLEVSVAPTGGVCGANGLAELQINGGTSPYTIDWEGPVSGSDTSTPGSYTLNDLPSGNYDLTITDDNGCETTASFEVLNLEDDLSFSATPINGVCGAEGEIQLSITGGTQDYTISWSGPESGSMTTGSNTFNIENLSGGTYEVAVTDVNGCDEMEMITLNNTEDDLEAMASAVDGGCFSLGYIWVDIFGGSGPYTISWAGPESGSQTVTDISNGFTISDLVSGAYTIDVTDPNGCSDTETATVNNLENDLAINLNPVDGICEELGAIQLNITGGDPMYVINWSGPVNGNTTTSNTSYTIPDLPGGTYEVAVTDENGCTETEMITITVDEGDLSLMVTPYDGGCAGNGIIWVDLLGGTPSYTISWTGPSSGSITTDDPSYHIPNLPSGNYQIEVTDDNGCSETGSASIDNTANLLSVSATPINGICGPSGTIEIDITGGNADYIISWNGPLSGNATISDNQYTLSNLPSGTYTIIVMDSGGCVQITSATIDNDESGDLEIVVDVLPGGCGEFGSIWVNIYNGDPHYIITWIGPSSGNITTLNEAYDVFLPNGEYEIRVMDGNGCIASEVVVITSIEDDLEISMTPMNGQCNNAGAIGVNITGGTPDYTISWDGSGISESATTNSNYYEITDLTSGTYTVSVTDGNNCVEVRYIPVNNQNNGFTLSATATPENCDQGGTINVQIDGGFPFYTINWSGPENGSVMVATTNYTIADLESGTYDISVTDENDCSSTYEVEIGFTGQSPIADFTFTTDNLTASFTNLSADGDYLWEFGDGNVSTEVNPVHTYSSNGSYNVCLTVTNGCGSDLYCTSVNATLPPDAVLLQAEDMSGTSGAAIQVPVTVSNLDMLVSLAGSVGIIDPSVATITGLTPGMITPLYNDGLQTFNFYDNSGTGISVNDGDVLFYIDAMLTGDPGDFTQIALTNDPLMIEVGSMHEGQPTVMEHVSLPGEVSIIGTSEIAGAITTFWGDGIPHVAVDVSTASFSSMEMTDDLGNYDLPDLPAGDMYYIDPSLDTMPANGLSTFALFIGQRFILGMEPVEIYSPYQVIAGDANCNGAFTTLDLFIIQQLIIGVNESFASCPSWVFVAQHNNDMPIDFDSYNVFPYIDVDTLMLMENTHSDFVGVKVGDILGAASPDPFADEEIEERHLDELYLTLDDKAISAGELVEFEFRSSNFDDIVSYQMNLAFDSDRLSFDAFVPGPHTELNNVIAGTNANEGNLRISWFNLNGNATSVNEDEVVFTIRAYAQTDIDNLEGLFNINSRYLRSEAHKGNTEPLEIVLELEEGTATNAPVVEQVKFELHQNVPNPFKGQTLIGFELPEATEATLTIHDNTGRVIRSIEGRFDRGYNQIELSKGDLESGVYHYTLKTSSYSATRNMVVLE